MLLIILLLMLGICALAFSDDYKIELMGIGAAICGLLYLLTIIGK